MLNYTDDSDAGYTYDAAGRIVKTNDGSITEDHFDGDGHLLKRVTDAGSTENEAKFYYIRSSALGKVISEAYPNGKKNKTFVPANGTTLAVQTLFGTEEYLTFNHTDASGTRALQTTASTGTPAGTEGEYSPMGRNVADLGPYITLNTDPPPGEGGTIDLFGSGQGYRPGQEPFKIDGMVVPAAQFMQTLDLDWFGGVFGLIMKMQRMSTKEVGKWYRETTWMEMIGEDITFHTQSEYLRTVYDSSWSTLLAIVPFFAQDYSKDVKLTKDETKDLKDRLLAVFKRSPKCREFLNKTLKNLGAKYKDILDVYDAYAAKNAIYNAPNIGDGEAPYPASHKKARLRLGLEQHKIRIEKGIESSDYTELTTFHELIHGSGATESYLHDPMHEAMYRAAVELGLIPKRELPTGDSEKLNSKIEKVREDEKWRITGELSKIGNEALKAACGASEKK